MARVWAQRLLLALAVSLTCGSLAATHSPRAVALAVCPEDQQISADVIDDRGFTISGGKCIPGSRTPGDSTYAYHYEPLCQANIPDQCAPRPCDTAEAPARWFLVTRTTRATGVTKEMGGGCYSTKHDPPVITPGKVLEALKTILIPQAAVTVQPPGGQTLVNLKTIVSSDSAPYERDISVLDQTVHVWLRPVTWTWDFGDNSAPVVRSDRGTPWQDGVLASEITDDAFTYHEYATADPAMITLTVTWAADYQAPGEDPEPVPGSIDITSPPSEIDVLEAVPQLVAR